MSGLNVLDRFFWCSWLLFIHVIDLFLTTQHDAIVIQRNCVEQKAQSLGWSDFFRIILRCNNHWYFILHCLDIFIGNFYFWRKSITKMKEFLELLKCFTVSLIEHTLRPSENYYGKWPFDCVHLISALFTFHICRNRRWESRWTYTTWIGIKFHSVFYVSNDNFCNQTSPFHILWSRLFKKMLIFCENF